MNKVQIENFRRVLFGQLGSYALVMSDADIVEMRDKMQEKLDAMNEIDYAAWKESLVTDPAIMAGETVFTGTRVTVKQIAQLVEAGEEIETILKDYKLTERDVLFSVRWLNETE